MLEEINKNNVIIKFTDDHLVEMTFEDVEGKQVKYITFNEFVESMISARMVAEGDKDSHVDSPILTHNLERGVCTIRTKEYENGIKFVVLMAKPTRVTTQYYDTTFNDVGIPRLLFALKINKNVIQHVKIMACKDSIITEDSLMYSFPFSNVNCY